MRATLEHVDAGTPGVRQKLRRLRELVDASKLNPQFRRLALDIVAGVPEGDTAGELAAVSRWVRRNVTYRRDPVAVELFTAPDLLASDAAEGRAAGDCDDHVALGAALAEVIGHPSRFAIGGHGIGKGGQLGAAWSHVWRQTWNGGRWADFDDTAKKRAPGWSPASRYGLTASAGEGKPATMPRMRCSRKVGVPCVDEFGQFIAGTARLVDVDRLADAGASFTSFGLGGADDLGKIGKKLKRGLKAVKKVAKKALPIVALAVNVFPGVGQVASMALTAAATAQKAQQQKKRARQAEQNFAREQAAVAAAEQAAFQASVQSPLPMPMDAPSYPRSGGTVVSLPGASPEFDEQLPPESLRHVQPPSYAPEEVFEPAWDDAKNSDALDALGSFWSSVASGFNAALPIISTAAGTGQLTVGGVSIPLGRDARRMMQPIQRYTNMLRPSAPAPAIVMAPPAVLRPTIVPTTTRRRRLSVSSSTAPQGGGRIGVMVAIGAGLLLLAGGRR